MPVLIAMEELYFRMVARSGNNRLRIHGTTEVGVRGAGGSPTAQTELHFWGHSCMLVSVQG
jgi:hypothetical protein